MNQYFETFIRFKGFGNPNGKYWFVGIEEAQSIDALNLEKIAEDYSQEVIPTPTGEIEKDSLEFGKSYTKVYDIMSKIITGENGDWKHYRNKHLLQKDSEEFQMNLYCLGKKGIDTWPKHYEKMFELVSFTEYIQVVKNERFKLLREFRSKHNPLITVCFGRTYWDEFREVFQLTDSDYKLYENGEIVFYPTERIMLSPFFIYHQLNSSKIKSISSIIKSIDHD